MGLAPIVRRLAILSALAPPLACGCSHIEADDSAGKTRSTTSGDGTPESPGESRGEDDGSSRPFAPSEDADARVKDSVLRNADLIKDEKQLAAIYRKLRPRLDRSRLARDLDTHDAALSELREASRILRGMGGEIIQAHSEFVAVSEQYRNDLARAPIAYRHAAECYREKAVHAPDRMLRDQYMKLHDNCLAFAASIQERSVAFAKFQAEVERLVEYSKRSVTLLQDIEDYTRLAPSSDSAEFRKSYWETLKIYVGRYAEFIAIHDRYSDSLKAQQLPSSLNIAASSPQPRPSMPVRAVASTPAAIQAAYSPGLPSISSATSLGETFARLMREGKAEYPSISARVRGFTKEDLPPSLKEELDRYIRKVEFTRAYEFRAISGHPSLRVDGLPPLDPGSLIPVVRELGTVFAGVVRVREDPGAVRHSVVCVQGDVKGGDLAVLPKGP